MRRVAGLCALAAAALGVVASGGRALRHGEHEPLLVAVRLLVPALLAMGGHLTARRDDDRGPVLLAATGLLLLESVVADARMLLRLPGAPTALGLAGSGQSALGVVAAGLALSRRGQREARLSATWGSSQRAVLGALVAALATAALYPALLTPEIRALEPLVVLLGAGGGLPSLVAAAGTVAVLPLAARASPAAGSLALVALALLVLGRVVLLLVDADAPDVSPSPWLWLRLVAGGALLVVVAWSPPPDRGRG